MRQRLLARCRTHCTGLGLILVVAAGVSSCGFEGVTTGQMVAVFVDPVNPVVAVGDTLRIRATSTIGSPCDCRWSSSAPGLASVDPTGLVRAAAPGRAVITAAQARFPEATASALVEVTAPKAPGILRDLLANGP